MRSILSIILIICFNISSAITYYVSPTGNDNNSGTSQSTPWKTISRVQQITLQAGDQVLFQKGGTYNGQLLINGSGNATSNIVIGSYGSGEMPIVSAAKLATNWSIHSGNIYKSNVSGSVKYVFANGSLQTLARFPNSGWLRVNTSSGTTQLTSNGITQPSGYWNGATLVARNTNWCYENKVITSQTGNTLNYPSMVYAMGNYDWGFFLCNKLSEIDSPGEWYHDPSAGILYFWASTNPNNISVEASIHDHGIFISNQRSFITIQDLKFRGQKVSGIEVQGSNILINRCIFDNLNHGIKSAGNSNTYTNNTFQNTFASGAVIYDNGTIVSNSTFTNIALIPGMGESAFGYFGFRVGGGSNIVRENRIHNVGNSGIFVGETVLVEKNIISNFCSTVNDGGGIYWDNGNSMIVQDNIIKDAVGNIESAATNYSVNGFICPGIYFGNAVIQNCIVQRNTVSNCSIGILADHTLVSTNNQIKNNTLFNNGKQILITDISNINGPGAIPPYYKESYNDIYSNNILYSLSEDQPCMEFHNWYLQGNVDFGTFTSNKIYNPYNELNIKNWNFAVSQVKDYDLLRWKSVKQDEIGSSSSPIYSYLVKENSIVGNNLVINGNFDSNVTGWGGWPPNGEVTRDLTYLDQGALRSFLPNATTSSTFWMHNPNSFQLTNQKWYKFQFSIQSSERGSIRAQIKAENQLANGEEIYGKDYPFGPERRDITTYFKSNMTSASYVQFVSTISEPLYWIDNVKVTEVVTSAINPQDEHILLVNDENIDKSFNIPQGCWTEVNIGAVSGSLIIPPYSSRIIYKIPDNQCNNAYSIKAKVLLGGVPGWQSGIMSNTLSSLGFLPQTEPYTSLGIQISNSGDQINPSLMPSVTDWIIVSLKSSNGQVENKSCLLHTNGVITDPSGNESISFINNVIGGRIKIRHRNHLSVSSNDIIQQPNQLIDFTSPSNCYGANSVRISNGRSSLWPGDINRDGSIKYTGSNNDRDLILSRIGGIIPTNTATGYYLEDLNLNGNVSYTGSNNDRDIVLMSIGGVTPTNVIAEQIP